MSIRPCMTMPNTTSTDRVNGYTCGFIDPQRMDTPRERYRNPLVTEGVQEPAVPVDS